MANFTYLLLDAGTLLAAVGMGIAWRLEWIHRLRRTVLCIGLVTLPFVVWDVVAAGWGHWAFNDKYILGPRMFGLPLEEYLFFGVVSLACLSLWQRLHRAGWQQLVSARWLLVPGALALIAGVGWGDRGYTAAAGFLTVAVCMLLFAARRSVLTRGWLRYQILLIGIFFVFNGLLTALPVVAYGDAHNSGLRLWTIPAEDLLYNFGLVNVVILIYTTLTARNVVR